MNTEYSFYNGTITLRKKLYSVFLTFLVISFFILQKICNFAAKM